MKLINLVPMVTARKGRLYPLPLTPPPSTPTHHPLICTQNPAPFYNTLHSNTILGLQLIVPILAIWLILIPLLILLLILGYYCYPTRSILACKSTTNLF